VTVLYTDTSALLKRVVIESESTQVRTMLRDRFAAGDLLVASSLAWVEVWRALRRTGLADIESTALAALSGIAELPLDDVVLFRSRFVGPADLRSLDAIHLASALVAGAEVVLTFDDRLAGAAEAVGLRVLSAN
jgi:predicted nucleic acid-binding protein